MNTPPAFDPAVFGGDPQTPPVPMAICWNELDPAGYARTLRDLAGWITWLRSTYRVPATVIPPCWFTHPGLREDIGHLWTGWLLTRHPDAGVGMTGLDWDARREQAITRLRDATAITGCTSTRHHDEPPSPDSELSRLWNEHIAEDADSRRRREVQRIIVDVVTEHLQAAELRHDLAPALLAELAANPSAATTEERAAIAARLHQISEQAAAAVDQIAADTNRTIADQHDLAHCENRVEAARRRVAETATIINAGDANDIRSATARREWLTAIENLVPVTLAVERATASAKARRTDSNELRMAAHRRHPHVGELLNPQADAVSGEH
ncbi:MAG TPA: hypothetical protein VIJ00_08990 [Nakamurella sp.]